MTTPRTELIYVPQGRTVRLTKKSKQLGIEGAYSDNFNFCHLVVLIGKDKISYTHADTKTFKTAIDAEIEWVGKDCKKYLFYRNNKDTLYLKQVQASPRGIADHGHTFIVHVRLIEAQEAKTSTWIHQPVTQKEVYGITVSIDALITNSPLKQIHFYNHSEKPKNFLRHIDEEKFSIAHKIEESGICCLSEKSLIKHNVIFDGKHWVSLPILELKPYHADQALFNSYLTEINKEKNSGTRKFAKNLQQLLVTKVYAKYQNITAVEDVHDLASYSVRFFQDYLSMGTPDELLHRDLLEVLEEYHSKFGKKMSESDRSFYEKLTREESVREIEKQLLFTKTDSHLIDHLQEQYIMFSRIHSEREMFRSMAETYQKKRIQLQAKVQTLSQEIKQSMTEYEKIAKRCQALLPSACLSLLNSEPLLRILYKLIGNCYVELKQYSEALPYLQTAAELAEIVDENYARDFKQPLEHCKELIKNQTPFLQEEKTVDKGCLFRKCSAGLKTPTDFVVQTIEALKANFFWEQSTNKNTALHWALEKGQYEKAIILLEEEKNFLIKNPACTKRILSIPGRDNLLPPQLVEGKELPPKLFDLLGIKQNSPGLKV